jgi:hypothetical protein
MKNVALYFFGMAMLLLASCGQDQDEYLLEPYFFGAEAADCEGIMPAEANGIGEGCQRTYFQDDFSNENGGWNVNDGNDYDQEVSGGYLKVATDDNSQFVYGASKTLIGLENLENFEIQIKFQVHDFGPDAGNSLFNWGLKDFDFDDFHELYFRVDGTYRLNYGVNGTETQIKEGTLAGGFVGNGVRFRHRRYDGTDYYFFDNELILQEPARPINGNLIWLGAGLDVEVWIDEVIVTELLPE